MKDKKLIVIIGPTASGKSDLAVKLAKYFGGEIISADSRQVYKGLDIGSGKITKTEMSSIPHYLLDVANPKKVFTVSQYQKMAQAKIKEIWKRNKTPIICGGTGLYIRAAVDGIVFPEVPPNLKLRKELEQKDTKELFKILSNLDKTRAKNIDAKNPRRLIRAIEILTVMKQVPKLVAHPITSDQNILFIGLKPSDKILKQKIKTRLNKRFKAKSKNNLITEVKNLHKSGLSWQRLEDLGLEYRYVALFLQNKLTKPELVEKINQESWRYAKRQLTWFKPDQRIHWLVKPADLWKDKRVKGFLQGIKN